MRIAYFVHDITDPAVAKRARMLTAAGADVVVFGFRRQDKTVSDVAGSKAVDLGRTHDAKLMERAYKVVQRSVGLNRWQGDIKGTDLLLARNLEMLVLAAAAQRSFLPHAPLVYECLDLHRLLLADTIAGKILRVVERYLLRRAKLLIISSPAFLSEYFEPQQGVNLSIRLPVLLVENKMLDFKGAATVAAARASLPPGPPWRIGWFGMIRCQKSLNILSAGARARPGLIEVIIRGRPSRVAFESFDAQVASTPGMRFCGTYQPSELAELYQSVHFNWAVDHFEEGANSTLLLPNRIYEGGRHAAVPIALAETETGRWLTRRGLGVLLRSPADELRPFLEELTESRYAALKEASGSAPVSGFVADQRDCERLLAALVNTCPEKSGTSSHAEHAGANRSAS